MATLIWTEPAVADLEEIGQFISKDNPPAAEKVGSRIIREAENIAAFPRLGRIVPEFGNPQIREIISQSYRVIYKFDEEGDLVISCINKSNNVSSAAGALLPWSIRRVPRSDSNWQ
jgi:toxin ParE1/3/4